MICAHPVPAHVPVLVARNISKSFSRVRVLDRVNLEVTGGTIHALVGANGAGKSTLMKIVAGMLQPDAGELVLNGQPFSPKNPHDALRAGVVMIHQELMPFRELTVAENIFVGRECTLRFGWLDKPRMRQEASHLLERVGLRILPDLKMKHLTVAQMQTVEIAKALAYKAKLLIMDEPTSAISEREVDKLFRIIRDLVQQGTSIIYISHRLDEIFRIADLVTVLRDGRSVGSMPITDVDRATLIELMVGREICQAPTRAHGIHHDVALEVCGLTKRGKFTNVSFKVRYGEIVGLAGLMGAGRTELAETIFGLRRPDEGSIYLDGKPALIKAPKDAIKLGLGFVPEDRQKFGIVPRMSVKQNITLSSLPHWWINRSTESFVADSQIRKFAIRVHNKNQPISTLSGGNQQKVVLARTLLTKPSILILDEPTRGIDVAAKAEMHAFIRRLADEGLAVLLISSELPELLSLSTRLLVMQQGRLTAELDPRNTTQMDVLRHAIPE